MFHFGKTSESSINVTVSNKTIIRVLLMTMLVVLGLSAVHKAQHAFVLIFTAFFLSLALNAPVHWIEQHLPGKRRGSRTTATALSFLVVILFLVGFLASIVPPLVRQTNTFLASAPALVSQAKSQDSDLGKFIRRYKLESAAQNFSDELDARLKNVGSSALTTVTTITSSIFSILAILALTFMMLVEGPRWLKVIRDLIPDDYHERVDTLAFGMYKVVKGYVNGQVTLAALAALLIMPMFFILGISYPIALMVIVFICGLIPMVGHTIGALIVTLVALFASPWAAAIILGYYFLYQQIENYLIQPRIQANTTEMSPLLVFISVLIGVSFGGIFGGLVAIPVAGCLRVITLDYLHRKQIIEPPDTDEYKK